MINIPNIGRIAAIAAATTLVAAAAVPAGAAISDPVGAPAKVKKETRYCVENPVSGSNIVRKTCKTRDAWIKSEGFDPIRHR